MDSINSITILHLEDSDLDALLVRDRLERSGLGFAIERVSSRGEFIARLSERRYDLILSDYRVPGFEGLVALDLAREHQPGTPFLFVSGAMGEELAVEALKRGATDYVLKQGLARLPTAIQRALSEERDRAERRKAEDRLEFALRAGRMGTWDLEPRTGRLICSDDFKANHGRAASDQLSYEDILAAVHEEDRERWRLALDDSIRFASDLDIEHRVRWPDGTVCWLLTRGGCETDRDGRVIAISGVSLNIDDRKKAEEALLAAEERLAFVRRSSGVGVWYCNLPFDVLRWDEVVKEQFYLPTDATVTLETFYACLHPDDREPTRVAIDRAIHEHEPFDVEYRTCDWSTGAQRWLRAIGRTFRDAGGIPTRFDGVTIDVTAQHRAGEERDRLLRAAEEARLEAEAANRMKDEFLSTLSHELRTPLNAIVGWTRILGSPGVDDEDRAMGLQVIDRNAKVQAQLIDDLLDISRIASGKLILDMESVRLQEVIDAAIDAVLPVAEAKGVEVEKLLDDLAGPVWGDRNRLQQVFWNLLTNAVKFTPRGGRVQVLLERANSHVEVSVNDSGQGIDPDFLPHVFDRFRQADSSTTRRHGGLGLGLAIVKQLVEMHGGAVRVKSAGEGKGASFVVDLPIPVARPGPVRPVRQEQSEPASECRCNELEGLRLLVVDDEPDARNLMMRVLSDRGARVESAASVDEALDLVDRFRPDVLISDIAMPGKDGYDLIRQVRRQHSAKELPAAAYSAFARSEDRMSAMRAGFQVHVAKPADPEELITVVATLAARTGGEGQGRGEGTQDEHNEAHPRGRRQSGHGPDDGVAAEGRGLRGQDLS